MKQTKPHHEKAYITVEQISKASWSIHSIGHFKQKGCLTVSSLLNIQMLMPVLSHSSAQDLQVSVRFLVCMPSEGSGETAQLCNVTWTFAACICLNHLFRMFWLIKRKGFNRSHRWLMDVVQIAIKLQIPRKAVTCWDTCYQAFQELIFQGKQGNFQWKF